MEEYKFRAWDGKKIWYQGHLQYWAFEDDKVELYQYYLNMAGHEILVNSEKDNDFDLIRACMIKTAKRYTKGMY